MTLAPVLLFVYNRPRHTERTLNELRKNELAGQSDLTIYCDGPRLKQDRSSVEETREIVRSVTGFKTVEVVERDQNMGLAGSIIKGVSDIIEDLGKVIVLEDDLVTSPCFLTFMNNALDRYENTENVFSVSGYNLPPSVMRFPRSYTDDVYFNPRNSSWGWATWRDRWAQADWEAFDTARLMNDPKMRKEFNLGGDDLTDMLIAQKEGRIDSWSIRWTLSHFMNNALSVYPVFSYVDNIGLDGSGVHCRADDSQRVDLSRARREVRFPENAKVNKAVMRAFREKYRRKAVRKVKMFVDDMFRRRKPEITTEAMRILKINNHDISGGAAKAAHRLHEGLISAGVDSRMLVKAKHGDDERVVERNTRSARMLSRIQKTMDGLPLRMFPNRARVPWSLGWFPTGIQRQVSSINPDIVHLHWVGSGQVAIRELSKLNRPIVWTLHDMWAFTGGCHYDRECGRYFDSCGKCPQLSSRLEMDVSRFVWREKQNQWKNLNLTIVTPSQWLSRCVRSSSILGDFRVEVIPNGLDLSTYRPVDKKLAREILGLPVDKKLILFGAMNATSDKRKGFDYLAEALRDASGRLGEDVELVVFGASRPNNPPDLGMKTHYMGGIHDELMICLLYSSADVTLVPSLQDNLPNIVMESLACGTPVVGFELGGIPDMVEHRKNGYLVKPFSSSSFADGVVWVLEDNSRLNVLVERSRKKVVEEFDLTSVVKRYCALYEDILSNE